MVRGGGLLGSMTSPVWKTGPVRARQKRLIMGARGQWPSDSSFFLSSANPARTHLRGLGQFSTRAVIGFEKRV